MSQISKISVFLDSETHREAKIAAMDAGQSLSTWIGSLIARQLAKEKRKPAVKSAA